MKSHHRDAAVEMISDMIRSINKRRADVDTLKSAITHRESLDDLLITEFCLKYAIHHLERVKKNLQNDFPIEVSPNGC